VTEAAVAAWRAAVAVVCGGGTAPRWREVATMARQRRGDRGAQRAAADRGRDGGRRRRRRGRRRDGGGRELGRRTARRRVYRAASRRSTENIDRALALEVKARKESDARMTALLAERAASAAAE